jgi:hypothetical protein
MIDEMPNRVWDLLRGLLARTEEGKLAWRQGSDDTEFVLTLSQGAVAITSVDNDGQAPYRFSILSPEGVRVESYDSAYVDQPEPAAWWREVGDLYSAARRSAVGSTEIVNALLDELEQQDAPRAPDDDIPF